MQSCKFNWLIVFVVQSWIVLRWALENEIPANVCIKRGVECLRTSLCLTCPHEWEGWKWVLHCFIKWDNSGIFSCFRAQRTQCAARHFHALSRISWCANKASNCSNKLLIWTKAGSKSDVCLVFFLLTVYFHCTDQSNLALVSLWLWGCLLNIPSLMFMFQFPYRLQICPSHFCFAFLLNWEFQPSQLLFVFAAPLSVPVSSFPWLLLI